MSNKTVVVAMSGGVDSSVAAALLLEQGYNIIGATLIFRPCDDNDNVSWCCGRGAQENARAVCQALGIRHYAIDSAKEFEQEVLKPAYLTYNAGKTPSPCIDCNQKIKFSILLDKALALGADYIATGHYAIINHGQAPTLKRGAYRQKDQTYFLFSLSKKQLNHTLFPLGNMTKKEVRNIAARYGFVNANRPESQDACFVTANGNFADALLNRFEGKPKIGPIVTTEGRALGNHQGIHHYTIGQRKGLNIALGQKAYVSHIDEATATVSLTTDQQELLSDGLFAEGIRWTGSVIPKLPLECQAQIRYRSAPVQATATIDQDNLLKVVFEEPQKSVAPGQAVVLYVADQVVGGGWITAGFKS